MSNVGRPVGTAVQQLSKKVIDVVLEGFKEPAIHARMKDAVVEPLMRMLYDHLLPYFLIVCTIMILTMLSSIISCIMLFLHVPKT